MVTNCKGCGEELTSIQTALSRYGHGDICSECGVREALSGDFINKYADQFSPDFPASRIK
jgi:hypothetical protein